MASRYQGFIPYAFRPIETSKPGERGERGRQFRNNKFKKAGVELLAYKETAFTSSTADAGSLVRKQHYEARERQTPIIKIKDRKPMEPKRFVAKSLSASSFQDHNQRLSLIDSFTEEDLKSSFSSFDKDQSGFLDRREMKNVFATLTNASAPPDISETFAALFDKNHDNRVSFEEFISGMVRLRDIVRGQLNTRALRHAGPAWAQGGRSERKVLKGYVPRSASEMDMGLEGENPSERIAMRGGAMKSTTEDLFSGTSKVTKHLPGYRGYISQSRPQLAEKTRDSKDDMFVVDNYRGGAAAGYTGNLKSDLRANRGTYETDKSRADKLVLRMWRGRECNPRSQFL